jgi:uncharacterized protein
VRACVRALSALSLAACAAAHAGNMCGTDDPAAMQSDLSLGHVAQQPASLVVCAYANLALKCGDHALAHRILDKCIAKGFAASMILKGLLFEDGRGSDIDLTKAAALYRQAAATGEGHYAALGKLHYASALHEGRGVPKDEAEARKWFQKAADEGSPDAEEFLRTGHHTGSRDVTGRGVGVAAQTVRGMALVKELPSPPARLPWLQHALLAALLAALMCSGAWRQHRLRGLARQVGLQRH